MEWTRGHSTPGTSLSMEAGLKILYAMRSCDLGPTPGASLPMVAGHGQVLCRKV
jgi:hypothetical protein